MPHELPPLIVSGMFTIGAAAVSGILTWFGGEKSGKTKGRAEFIDAVERAAALVITRLEGLLEAAEAKHADCVSQHQDCVDLNAAMKAQIAELMAGPIPAYHNNANALDG